MTLHPRSIFAIAAIASAGVLPGQSYGTPEELMAKRDEKLDSGFLRRANWFTDYDEALAEAKNDDKLIFAYFTRSYTPSPACDIIEAGPLSEDSFEAFGERVVLLAHVTSYVAGERHGRLLTDKGGTSFPTVMFLDRNGEVLTVQRESELTVGAFNSTLDTLNDWIDLKARAAAGERDVAKGLFLAELKLGRLDFARAKTRLTDLEELTEQEKAEVMPRMYDLEFEWVMSQPGSPDGMGRQLVDMKNAGRIPTGPAAQQFWTRIMTYAAYQDVDAQGNITRPADADLFEEGLEAMKKLLAGDERHAARIQAMERVLKELRGGL